MANNHLIDQIFDDFDHNQAPFIIRPQGNLNRHEFMAEANKLCHALIEYGVLPGDRVAVQVEKSAHAFALYVAVVKMGGVFLPLNTGYTTAELEYFFNDAMPSVVVVDPQDSEALAPVVKAIGAVVATMDSKGGGSLFDRAKTCPDAFDAAERKPDDLAAILYTSGTTGRSKGAMLSHLNLASNTQALVKHWRYTADDVLLHALPIYHTHGLFVAGNVVAASGASMIFLQKFDRDQMLDYLPEATTMMGVPTFYTRLLQDERFNREATSHMRLFISGSAPLLAETHIEFETRTGHRILERYGMTETNMNTSNPYDGERRAGTVGMPLDGVEARITDPETGQILPQGAIGIIEVKGDNVTSGYWQNDEKTQESFTKDGFFITGDMAMIDADGYITIVGRDKDMIISGGLNIYPKEIEDAINAIDGVVESAVIGVPHDDFGEGVVAVIVGDDGLEPSAISAKLSGQLAKFKQPKKIIIVDGLPRNTMGKVQKAAMRQDYGDLFKS